MGHDSRLGQRMFARIIRKQVFVDAYALKQFSVLIVTQLNQPAKHIGLPFGTRDEFFRISAQRSEQLGNLSVMPANQDVFTVRPVLNLLGQFQKLFVLEPTVNWQAERLAERLEGKARATTLLGIRRRKQIIQSQGF